MIRHFAREGVPIAQLSRRFGVSRQTVYNHVGREGPYRKPRKARTSQLDPYKDHIRSRLDRFDLPATVLWRELRSRGYGGGITILRDFVRSVKQGKVRDLTERYETEAGRQAQIDFAECGMVVVDGRSRKLYLFDFVLGYSRMMWSRFILSTRVPELLSCLKAAFTELGIPREVLVDNMKQAVERHDPLTGVVRFNRHFLDFAGHYGFLPVAAPPYWPRVKGKVERNIDYVKRSFLCGRCFVDVDDLNAQFRGWQAEVANVRIHGTTGSRPVDRYREEREVLHPAHAIPTYDTRPVEIRQVGRDSHISYEGVSYSVDPVAVGRSVVVRSQGDRVGDRFEVYVGSDIVAIHCRHPRGTPRVTLPEHAEAIRRLTRKAERSCRDRKRATPYDQILPSEMGLALTFPVPTVEVVSLDRYEALLGGGS